VPARQGAAAPLSLIFSQRAISGAGVISSNFSRPNSDARLRSYTGLRIDRVESARAVSTKYFSAHLPNVSASDASTRFPTFAREGLSPRWIARQASALATAVCEQKNSSNVYRQPIPSRYLTVSDTDVRGGNVGTVNDTVNDTGISTRHCPDHSRPHRTIT
jgi:hypothetical protein